MHILSLALFLLLPFWLLSVDFSCPHELSFCASSLTPRTRPVMVSCPNRTAPHNRIPIMALLRPSNQERSAHAPTPLAYFHTPPALLWIIAHITYYAPHQYSILSATVREYHTALARLSFFYELTSMHRISNPLSRSNVTFVNDIEERWGGMS